MEKSGEYLAASIECLERLIKEEKQLGQPKSHLKVFEYHFMLVKSHLQYAAILSHLVNHESALTQAQLSKEKVKDCSRSLKKIGLQYSKTWVGSSLDIILDKFIFEITNRDPTVAYDSSYKVPEDLKEQSKVSSSLGQSEGNPSMGISGNRQTSGIIFWKHNPKNNEKYLKKELSKRYGDSFKGKKMTTAWLEEFNIGNIMHLNPITYKELMLEDLSVQSILSEDKLVELILVYSCCLFSIATENRFICHKELETDKKTTELNGPVNPVAKNYQLLQNKNFKQS